MRVFLTGATGFLGNNLLRILLANGHQVTVLLRHSSNLETLDGLNVEKVYGDLTSGEVLEAGTFGQVLEGMDCVIHSAALIQLGWSRRDQSMKVNVDATSKLAAAARRHGVRMVHVSSVDALAAADSVEDVKSELDMEPAKLDCSYVASKRASDSAFRAEIEKGLEGVIVHPGFMVGPWDWKPSSGEMMLAIHKNLIYFAPAGSCSVVDVRDVADGIVAATSRGRSGEAYILGGENMTYLELWKLMTQVIGKRPPARPLPDWLAGIAGRAGDLMSRFTANEMTVNSAATAMGQMHHRYDSSKAITELGYRIGSVEDGLRDAWEWFRQHGYV